MTPFTEPGISDELAEKIVAFVDREAGREAPLSADDEAMVRRLMEDDPDVRALADELRATNAGLDRLLDDVAAVEVPEKLVALIRGHGSSAVAIAEPGASGGRDAADDKSAATGDVVAFQRKAAPRPSYGPLAAAASIALLISSGALYQVYTSSADEQARLETALATANDSADEQARALADARVELQRLTSLADQASDHRQETADQLAANEETVQQLEVARAELQGRYTALQNERQRLETLVEQQRTDLAASEEARDQVAERLAEAESQQSTLQARVNDLVTERDAREREMASLTENLEGQETASATARAELAAAVERQADLRRRLASTQSEMQDLLAARDDAAKAANDASTRLASLEAEVSAAESRLATVTAAMAQAEAGRQNAVQQVAGLEDALAASRDWLGQIAQYHRVYASTARRHLVEVTADEEDHIQDWLTGMLGRDIQVPDLSEFGVTFAGARLLGVNERPVAQLVYLDADDQPLALCIIPSDGEAKSPTLSSNRDLNLVDWRDGQHGYAVVGWSDPALLNSLAEAIQPVYDL